MFLSRLTIESVSGKTATEESLLLGALQSTEGSQDYLIPEGVSLADFERFLVNCEKYSVLWGSGDLDVAGTLTSIFSGISTSDSPYSLITIASAIDGLLESY